MLIENETESFDGENDLLLDELYSLVDIQDNGYALNEEEQRRYVEITNILHENNVAIPFGIAI